MQPTLALWDEPVAPRRPHTQRVVASASDRVAWLRARAHGVTATDAARLTSVRAAEQVAVDKLLGTGFGGNDFTAHGRAREPEIARWVSREHRIAPNELLFHADADVRHLATPDGVAVHDTTLVLCEIKTTASAWRSIPRSYLRQVWWQQYVLGAERTLVVWEQHRDFVPVDAEPQCRWVDRDENEIHMLLAYAEHVLTRLRR
ncbi:YqaJ viral recombinase family protein [Galbitalea sp. SE-J8]|uniref:YqaJ viral recombinase family protein n=1 Tax=Galbitalea sp. SE-J8 TaxID=3054952 RepID=UPI00259CAAB1|nr:YqaJ viral recombinase family protein [Galbitalea sp. SE-J8]MDM4762472.1 YqaJ viral recombinase family protein [Galbitalea sp. SE-J8]